MSNAFINAARIEERPLEAKLKAVRKLITAYNSSDTLMISPTTPTIKYFGNRSDVQFNGLSRSAIIRRIAAEMMLANEDGVRVKNIADKLNEVGVFLPNKRASAVIATCLSQTHDGVFIYADGKWRLNDNAKTYLNEVSKEGTNSEISGEAQEIKTITSCFT